MILRQGRRGRRAARKGRTRPRPAAPSGVRLTADKQLQGRKPGDRRIRLERPQSEYFRYSAPDTLVARPKAHEEQRSLGKSLAFARRMLFGRPLATEEEISERLSKTKALAIFSSDAISSARMRPRRSARARRSRARRRCAYGVPISIAIAILLAVVAISYRQVCIAYPTGGGSYSVSKANFGRRARSSRHRHCSSTTS